MIRRQTELIWGFIALALAAWWGARTFGLLPLGLDDFIQRALPALLVLAGLTLLLRRRLPVGGLIALVLTAALVGVLGYSAYSSRATQQRTDVEQPIIQVVNPDLTLLRLRVSTLATDVDLLGGVTPDMVNGSFIGSTGSGVDVEYQESGDGSATLTMRETRVSGDFPLLETVGRGTLQLELPPSVPLDVEFLAADGSVVLNLGGVDLERMNVTAQSGNLVVTLPDYDPLYSQPDDMLGTLTAQNGSLAIFVPLNISARLELNRGGSGIEPQFNPNRYFELAGDVLVAQDISTATNVVRYTLTAPRGLIRVEDSP